MAIETNFIGAIECAIGWEVRDNHHVLEHFGVTREDVLQLCGGVPAREVLFVNVEIISSSDYTVIASVQTNLYQVFRTINFDSKEIFNDKMRVFDKEQHLGTSLFLNQVAYARQLRFIRLNTTALEWDGNERWDGYYRWARLGYQMTDRNDLEDFNDLKRYFSHPVENLSEMVLLEDGYAFWINQGFTWVGEFLLAADSPSMEHLRRYLTMKKIDFTF